MIVQPVFRPHIRPVGIAGTGVLLLSEEGPRLLRGPLCESLLPLVDGLRTADEIAEALEPRFPPTHVYYTLLMLERSGYLVESHQQAPHANSAFWSLYGLNSCQCESKLATTRISIRVLGRNLCEELLIGALTGVGVQTGDDGNLLVALVDDYLDPGLEAINQNAIRVGNSWIVVKPTGSTPWIGPLFNPFQSACWECLASRLREHRSLEASSPNNSEICPSAPACDTLLTRQIAYNILATEIQKWVASEQHCKLLGKVLSLDTRNWQTKTHLLVRRPECPACGADRYQSEPVPIELDRRRILFTADGGYRCSTPDETMRRYGHHVSPITGVIRALYRQQNATKATNAYIAVEGPMVWGGRGRTRPTVSGGKGITDAQAKASALCEALERYSGVYRGYEASVISTLRALGDRAIHPNSCMLYSDKQYRCRDEHNTHGSRYKIVPEPLEETAEIRWSPVWSLSRKEFRFLPTSYCYFGYRNNLTGSTDLRFSVPCSNGNAAGNTLEEAILQGVLELVERDSVAIWWYNSIHRLAVDLPTFSEPYFAELQEHYQQAGRRLWVLDITSDLGIPTFAAILSRLDGGGLLLGFGCHLDARLGIARALTEVNQMYLEAFNRDAEPDAATTTIDQEMTNWTKTLTIANQPQVLPDPTKPPSTAVEYRQRHDSDICDAVLECQTILEKHGLEMLVLDQTRPNIGLAVVKVFVPGLRHFWPRFAPGRLYEVPLKQNWLVDPRREEELNPTPILF